MEDALTEIEVQALDNAGNSATEIFRMGAAPEDVINISLPDSFSIVIRPLEDKENWQIYGEDVVADNQNDFPVEVTLARVEVYIDHSVPDSDVNETDSGNAGKVEDALQAENDSSNPLNAADDPTCAVFNICGNLSDGSEMLWRDGDLKVTLTLQYNKLP